MCRLPLGWIPEKTRSRVPIIVGTPIFDSLWLDLAEKRDGPRRRAVLWGAFLGGLRSLTRAAGRLAAQAGPIAGGSASPHPSRSWREHRLVLLLASFCRRR